jgi:STE24 endopeptidase
MKPVDSERMIFLSAVALIAARWVAQLILGQVNQRHVRAHASVVPAAYREVMDDATYARSIQYTLAGSRFSMVEHTFDFMVLLAALFTGILPWLFGRFDHNSIWSLAAYLFVVFTAFSWLALPLQWWDQFRLEQRFGFNTTTQRTWWLDRIKGFILGVALGYPLLVLMLKLVTWAGRGWWIWAWAVLLGVQLVLSVLAPILILPLFNKFAPLPGGTLRDRLLGLAQRTRFRAAAIQVMDGSRRSRHSNAFFTGLGRFRKIVLFDTLINQLAEPELEAVLAHEIGHWKKRHITQRLVLSGAGSLAGLAAVAWLSRQPSFAAAFGFHLDTGSLSDCASVAPVLLLFGLLAGPLMFWLSPVANAWSRRHEYQADAYAREVIGQSAPLVGALRKLNEKNLSNLTPHPLYSGFYYSHPTLLERERALSAG